MKSLILALLLLPICATAAPRLDWRRSGNNIVFSWPVVKSHRYQLRWSSNPRGPYVNLLFSMDSCYVGTASHTQPINNSKAIYIQLIDVVNLRRCP